MSNIQVYLKDILNAIYGKDVRQAIHDGIQQCYYDGKAGTTDLEARQRLDSAEKKIVTAEGDIDVLTARVDQIIAPSGEAPSAAEVADARVVGELAYPTVGDAMRTQFDSLSRLAISEDLTSQFISGGYIPLNVSIGTTIDVTAVTSSTNRKYIVVPCKKGDWFIVTGYGGSAPRLWGVLDASYKLLRVSAVDAHLEGGRVSITEDGYFICQVHTSYTSKLEHYEYMLSGYFAKESELEETNEEMSNKSDIRAVPYGYESYMNDASIWEKGYINSTNGSNASATSATGRIRIRTIGYISGVDCIKWIGVVSSYFPTRIVVHAYNSDDTYVGVVATGVTSFDAFDYENYKYRIVVERDTDETVETALSRVAILANKNNAVLTTDVDYTVMRKNYISSRAIAFDYAQDLNDDSLWVQGRIDSTTGNDVNSGTLHPYRIRTAGYIPSDIEKIACTLGFFTVYTYTSDGTYVGVSEWLKEYNSFEEGKKYRLVYATSQYSWGQREVNPSDNWSDLHFLKNELDEYSVFKKHIAWGGSYPSDWYAGKGQDYSLFDTDSTYEDVVDAYDSLMAISNGYMTRETIGTASDGQTMYAYYLTPTLYRNITIDDNNRPPTIMIVPSQHGFEKSASFGTYYFARDLVLNFFGNSALESMRSKCCFIIIPVANPWGFDNNQRKNYNGVDLNRNWGEPNGTEQGGSLDPDSPYYAGAEPFDQPETQAIKAIVDANPNMFYVIDFHTNGQYRAPSWENCNWISMVKQATTDGYYMHAYEAALAHISTITENMQYEYNLNTSGAEMGNVTVGTSAIGGATIGSYLRNVGIMGHTFEGNNGFPSEDAPYSSQEQKANSELVGNFIKTLLATFASID